MNHLLTVFMLLMLAPVGQASKPDTLFRYLIDGQAVENLTKSLLVDRTIQVLDIDTIRTPDHITLQYTIKTAVIPAVSKKVYMLDGEVVSKEVIDHLNPSSIKEIIVDLNGGERAKEITGNDKTGIVIVTTKKQRLKNLRKNQK